MDSVLLDDVQLAKAFLVDSKVAEFSGKISIESYVLFDNWASIKLEQSSGYKIDLVLRVEELIQNYGSDVSVRYWVSKSPKTTEELIEHNVFIAEGYTSTELEAKEVVYSEYTRDMEYTTEFRVGGHDFIKELQGKNGWYLYMMIEFK